MGDKGIKNNNRLCLCDCEQRASAVHALHTHTSETENIFFFALINRVGSSSSRVAFGSL